MAKNRIESKWESFLSSVDIYYFDLIRNRQLSNEIAERTNVRHESPQLIVLKSGKVVCHFSHMAIDVEEVTSYI